MKRVAVIGLGEIAKVHVPILMQMPEVELCAVCDLREERGKLASGVPVYTDYHQMLAEQKPDCVHLCLPHWLHYPVAKDVVEAGINVFCEKPLALNAGQAREFAKLEQDHPEVKIGLCLQNRYNETTEELLRIIQSGEEGAVTSVRASVVWAQQVLLRRGALAGQSGTRRRRRDDQPEHPYPGPDGVPGRRDRHHPGQHLPAA